MTFFFVSILAGLAWMGLRGDVGVFSFAFGVALGAFFWRIERARSRRRFALGRAARLVVEGIRVLGLFLLELVVANGEQLRVVLAPRIRVAPRWVHFHTALESPALRALLGVMVSLTPGTLIGDAIEVEDGHEIWIHVLDGQDPDATIARIRERLEEPLRALERP